MEYSTRGSQVPLEASSGRKAEGLIERNLPEF
jgi:hypothetical protein